MSCPAHSPMKRFGDGLGICRVLEVHMGLFIFLFFDMEKEGS